MHSRIELDVALLPAIYIDKPLQRVILKHVKDMFSSGIVDQFHVGHRIHNLACNLREHGMKLALSLILKLPDIFICLVQNRADVAQEQSFLFARSHRPIPQQSLEYVDKRQKVLFAEGDAQFTQSIVKMGEFIDGCFEEREDHFAEQL